MRFATWAIAKALAIVNIFETGKPFGSPSAVAVLDDGAGISYGIGQFTHRSGALAQVVERYLIKLGRDQNDPFSAYLLLLRKNEKAAVDKAAADSVLKRELKRAGNAAEMREAQAEVLFERYLAPAIRICEERNFERPLSLAVVYDSVIHGSFERIAAAVKGAGEKEWVTEYAARRDRWLASVKRLQKTRYRTQFFLGEIERNNWDLELPLVVHGRKIAEGTVEATASLIYASELKNIQKDSADSPASTTAIQQDKALTVPTEDGTPTDSCPPNKDETLDVIEGTVNYAAAKYDRVEAIAKSVTTRADSAKALWTTVAGTLWQAVWAIVGFIAGLPREVWLVAALVAALLAVLYLYRQFALGRIREMRAVRQGENYNA